VGLEIPEGTPLAPESGPEAFAAKYAAPLASRVGDLSSLTGVDNLKAQLYGLPGVGGGSGGGASSPADGAGAYRPLGGQARTGGGGGASSSSSSSSSTPLSLREAVTTGPVPPAPPAAGAAPRPAGGSGPLR
jgi:hypothetical protein